MTEEDLPTETGTEAGAGRAARPLPDHPVRIALLDLLAETGTVTSTQAARRLGYSSGLCSFHLRRLARHGLIEEAPHNGGRVRPWRLRWDDPRQSLRVSDHEVTATLHLTPDEATQLAAAVRDLLTPYERRRTLPPGTEQVSVTTQITRSTTSATSSPSGD